MPLAYTDPGTGSMVVQVAVAGAAGLAVAVKLGWRRAAARVRRLRPGDEQQVGQPATRE
jgi:hypothetical protein